MFAETIIASVAIGVLLGMWIAYLLAIRPVDKALEEQRQIAHRAFRQSVYREEAKREHKGTPYIRQPYVSPDPSPLEILLADIQDVGNDHDASSLRADLRVV